MATDFSYDVFLSHSAKDKPIVRALAERLKANGIRVWFDEWEIKPGDSIPSKIKDALPRCRTLVLCMSENVSRSEWAAFEHNTFVPPRPNPGFSPQPRNLFFQAVLLNPA